jgi:tRNA A-37 threonylcarbamoyl transferase component Bud32
VTGDQRDQVVGFLRRQGLLAHDEDAAMTRLTGGVSSDLWKVDLPPRAICVKRALPELRVAAKWSAPVSRNRVEHAYLQFAATVCPGRVPQVLAHDPVAGLFAMEYLAPDRHPVWKQELLSGRADPLVGEQVGALVGRLHAASAADRSSASVFATDDNFHALRINPFFLDTARAHRDLQEEFLDLAARTMSTRAVVVHGDVSPKNILLGPDGPVLLDAECAWYGDPAFDIAFCINHLLLKTVLLPALSDPLFESVRRLMAAYQRHVDWEPTVALDRRVATLQPALALARVDGTSPAEYLDAERREQVRRIGRSLMGRPPSDVDELVERWAALAATGTDVRSSRPRDHREGTRP